MVDNQEYAARSCLRSALQIPVPFLAFEDRVQQTRSEIEEEEDLQKEVIETCVFNVSFAACLNFHVCIFISTIAVRPFQALGSTWLLAHVSMNVRDVAF